MKEAALFPKQFYRTQRTVKREAKTCNLFCNIAAKLNSGVARFTTHKPGVRNQILAGCKKSFCRSRWRRRCRCLSSLLKRDATPSHQPPRSLWSRSVLRNKEDLGRVRTNSPRAKVENGQWKENITLRSLRCPHLVLLSPVCLPGTEAINRTLQQNWVLRMLHQNYQALYLLYLFSLDLLQREKFIAIIFILLFCCLYINENWFIN